MGWARRSQLLTVDKHRLIRWRYLLTPRGRASCRLQGTAREDFFRAIREVLRLCAVGWMPPLKGPTEVVPIGRFVLVRNGAEPPYPALVLNGRAAFLTVKGNQRSENTYTEHIEVADVPNGRETLYKLVRKPFLAALNEDNLARLYVEAGNPLFEDLTTALTVVNNSVDPNDRVDPALIKVNDLSMLLNVAEGPMDGAEPGLADGPNVDIDEEF